MRSWGRGESEGRAEEVSGLRAPESFYWWQKSIAGWRAEGGAEEGDCLGTLGSQGYF